MTDERRSSRAQLLHEVLNDSQASVELTERVRRDQEIIDAAQAVLIAEGVLDAAPDTATGTEPVRRAAPAPARAGIARRLAGLLEALTYNMSWRGAAAACAVAALAIGITMTMRAPRDSFDPSTVVRGGQSSAQAVRVADPLAARDRLQSQLTELRIDARPEEFIGAPALRIELPKQPDSRVTDALVALGVTVPASGGELLVYFELPTAARP